MCSEMKFFQKARPVWAKGRETELNVTLVFRAVCPRRSEAKLAVTGCAYYNIYVNGTFLAVALRGRHTDIDGLTFCRSIWIGSRMRSGS